MSFRGIGPSVAMLSGRNMSTVPNDRMMSGTARSASPVRGLSVVRRISAMKRMSAPIVRSTRASNLLTSLPAMGIMNAEASALGKSSMPVCCEV